MISRILIVGSGGIGRRHYKLAKILLPKAEIFVLTRHKSEEKSYVPLEKQLNLEESMDKYNRMLQLNHHIQELFKKKLHKIKGPKIKKNKKSLISD